MRWWVHTTNPYKTPPPPQGAGKPLYYWNTIGFIAAQNSPDFIQNGTWFIETDLLPEFTAPVIDVISMNAEVLEMNPVD